MTVTATLTRDNWVRAYLTLWQGMLGLTEKELEVAISMVKHFMSIKERVADNDTASLLMLSRQTRRKIKFEHQISAAGFGNYLISFCKKGFLVKKEGAYMLAEKIIPTTSITFNFNITNDTI
jgi:ABC-type Fe3+-hydroxamate transport system substrate-binding protein